MKSKFKIFLLFVILLFFLALGVFLFFLYFNQIIQILQKKTFSKYTLIIISSFSFFLLDLFFLGIVIGKLTNTIKDEQKIRKDALNRSRAVLSGLAIEQVAPFLPNFPCSPADVRFVGKPVDFVAFSGMSEKNKIDEIILIEVKSGKSNLSDIEKQVKTAIENGKVRYEEYRPKI